MTKRIISGIFVLTALAALGVILAGALTDGDQLIVRFLTAIVVAGLGLYVISDLRLQSNRETEPQANVTVEALPNSTVEYMNTVTAARTNNIGEVPTRPTAMVLEDDPFSDNSHRLTDPESDPFGLKANDFDTEPLFWTSPVDSDTDPGRSDNPGSGQHLLADTAAIPAYSGDPDGPDEAWPPSPGAMAPATEFSELLLFDEPDSTEPDHSTSPGWAHGANPPQIEIDDPMPHGVLRDSAFSESAGPGDVEPTTPDIQPAEPRLTTQRGAGVEASGPGFQADQAPVEDHKQAVAARVNSSPETGPTPPGDFDGPGDELDGSPAPIIDLRQLDPNTDEKAVQAAIRAGEVEVVKTLIEQGMLSTTGPITDRDVRTMVYVAFTSNELRKLILAGGRPNNPGRSPDLGPVELFDERKYSPAPRTYYTGLVGPDEARKRIDNMLGLQPMPKPPKPDRPQRRVPESDRSTGQGITPGDQPGVNSEHSDLARFA